MSLYIHVYTETACLQEDVTSSHLSNLVYNSTQLCCAVGHFADVLHWVQRSVVGSGSSGSAVYWMWTHNSREMQRSAQRWLYSTLVCTSLQSLVFPIYVYCSANHVYNSSTHRYVAPCVAIQSIVLLRVVWSAIGMIPSSVCLFVCLSVCLWRCASYLNDTSHGTSVCTSE